MMRLYEFLEKHPQYEDEVKEHLKEQEFEQAMRAKHLASLTAYGLVYVEAPKKLEGPIFVETERGERSTLLKIKPAS